MIIFKSYPDVLAGLSFAYPELVSVFLAVGSQNLGENGFLEGE